MKRDYVAERIGGGWCVMWWDEARQIHVEGSPHQYKRQAMDSMREEHARSKAAALLGSMGGKTRTEAKARASRENGKTGGRPRGEQPWVKLGISRQAWYARKRKDGR